MTPMKKKRIYRHTRLNPLTKQEEARTERFLRAIEKIADAAMIYARWKPSPDGLNQTLRKFIVKSLPLFQKMLHDMAYPKPFQPFVPRSVSRRVQREMKKRGIENLRPVVPPPPATP